MNLAQWQQALKQLAALARQHGHNAIPIPAAMEALQADSRSTFYRRLADMREAGWFATANEQTGTLAVLAPEDEARDIANEIAELQKGYNE